MRILVAQMTRMGDVLQTSPLICALKQQHPDAHITAMVRRMGKPIVERNPDVDDVIVYEEDNMFLDMRARDSDRLLRAFERAESYIDRIKAGRFDLCYNCTNSVSSAMLLKIAEVPHVVGVHMTDDWQFVQRGPWTKYFFTGIFNREYSDLNLCDVFRHFASGAPDVRNLVFEVRDADRAFVNSLLDRHGVHAGDFVACFQLGASEDSKRWSEAHFATVGRMLVERRNARIALVGVKEEAHLGQAFAQHAPGTALQLYGQTMVPQLAALLERANVLVTNDTGTMHIAAAVGCPTVLVSVGHVHFRETGPYGAGHCAVECRRQALGDSSFVPGGLEERERLQPRHVMRAIETTLEVREAGFVPHTTDAPDLADAHLHMSQFAPDGCLEWYPVLRRELTQRDLLRIAYRAMWLDHLGAQKSARVEDESFRAMLGCYSGPPAATVETWRAALAPVFGQLAALGEQGGAATDALLDSLRDNDLQKAKEQVAGLTRHDEDIRLFGELHESTRPLVRISRYERDNLEGADPLHLAETTREIYEELAARARLVMAKAERAADVFRSLPA